MDAKRYLDLLEKHRKELSNFPIAYAFNEQQMNEALEKLGTEKEECCTVFGHGDILRKKDAKSLITMLERHVDEIHELMEDEELAEAIFLYEMDNHEYAINWDGDEDVLGSLSLTGKRIEKMELGDAYTRAKCKHMKHAEEW